jgi:hypothetical protein
MTPTVPVPGFTAAAIMDSYATNQEELALLIVRVIRRRKADDPDPDRATKLSEAAAYVSRWVLSIAINTKRMPGPTKQGVGTATAYCRCADDWAQATHMRHLPVKARSLIQHDDHSESPRPKEDAIRNLSNHLESQAAQALTPPQVGIQRPTSTVVCGEPGSDQRSLCAKPHTPLPPKHEGKRCLDPDGLLRRHPNRILYR